MTTSLPLSVTAQNTSNVRFNLFNHNKIWDKSVPSIFLRVANVAVQIFKEAFKYIANAGLTVLNNLHSLFFSSRKVQTANAATNTNAVVKPEEKDHSLESTIDMSSIEVDGDEGIPAENPKEGLWTTAAKATAGVAVALAITYGVARYYGHGISDLSKLWTPTLKSVISKGEKLVNKAGEKLKTVTDLLVTYKDKACITKVTESVTAVQAAHTDLEKLKTTLKITNTVEDASGIFTKIKDAVTKFNQLVSDTTKQAATSCNK